MQRQLQHLCLLASRSNYVMEALLQTQLNTVKSLAPYSTYLSPVRISHLRSINYLNLCIDHLLCIGLQSNEYYDIFMGLSIMASFFANTLPFISMPLLMLIGQGILMIEHPHRDIFSSLDLIRSVGVPRSKRQLHVLQLKLNTVPLPPQL